MVGINRSGKSTLLRILTGLETADSGVFSFTPADLRIGYLEQGFEFSADETVQSFLDEKNGAFEKLTSELAELAVLLMIDPGQMHLQAQYGKILSQLEFYGQQGNPLQSILSGLGLDHLDPDTPICDLSGGQKTRLMLAGILLGNPQLLLLDEPTNQVDIEMLSWLEDWINHFCQVKTGYMTQEQNELMGNGMRWKI